jgi:hypothetical protein
MPATRVRVTLRDLGSRVAPANRAQAGTEDGRYEAAARAQPGEGKVGLVRDEPVPVGDERWMPLLAGLETPARSAPRP